MDAKRTKEGKPPWSADKPVPLGRKWPQPLIESRVFVVSGETANHFFCRPKGTSSPNLAIGTDNERDSDRSAPPLVLRATFFLHRRNVEKEPQSKRVRIMS